MTRTETIEYAVLCDETRREDNGKLIMIGVYSDAVLVDSFPANISFKLVLALRTENTGPLKLLIEIRVGETPIAKSEGTVDVERPGLSFVQIPLPLLNLSNPSTLSIRTEINGTDFGDVLCATVGLISDQSPT